MNDVRQLLDQARRQAPPTCVQLDQIRELRERHEWKRRVGATVTGLLVFAIIAAGFILAARHDVGQPKTLPGSGVDLSVADGEYYYLSFDQTHTGYSGGGDYDRTTWWGNDASGRYVDGDGDVAFGPGELGNRVSGVTYLSTDPAVLDGQIRERVEPGGASPEPYREWIDDYATPPPPDQEGPVTWGLVRSYGELFRFPNMSPAQKAALFEVAANLAGMERIDGAVDPEGRPAVLLKIQTEDRVHEWWFDPDSHQLLAMRETGTDEGWTQTLIVHAAGVAASTDSPDLVRSFIPEATGGA